MQRQPGPTPRRSVRLLAACAVLVSCGGESMQVSRTAPPPPAPLPRSESPAAVPPAPAVETAAVPVATEPHPAPPPRAAAPARPAVVQDEIAQRFHEMDLAAISEPFAPNPFEDGDMPALDPDSGSLLDEITQEAIPEDYDVSQTRLARLQNTKSEMPLTLSDQVLRMINYFAEGRGRTTLRLTLGRSGAFRETIERILAEEDVPLELFYLAQAESGFRTKAKSYARATGMWQFMAFRGKQYDLRQDRYLEERYDFEKATRAAAQHLKDLYIEFGDWNLAMAAYNAGPGRVQRAIEKGGTRDYWELCRKQLLPKQTRDYVPIIQAMTYVGKNLDMYDVGTIDYAPPRRYDTVTVDGEISLDLIADITGSSVTELEELNEALLRSATPPYRYDLRVPAGTADRFRREIARVPADKRLQWRWYEAGEGSTATEIAKRFGVPEHELLSTNGLGDPSAALAAGTVLHIPTQTKLRVYQGPSGGGSGGLMESGTGRYRIASGDTLGGIATRFGVTVAQLRAWNSLPDSRIRAGRYLIVRPGGGGAGAPGAASSSASPNGSYQVRRGDTLGAIASRVGASVAQLQAWNGLRSTQIHVGQTLKVPTRTAAAPASAAPPPPAPALAPDPAAPSGQYRVRSGDTLGAIATRFGVSVDQLKAWNGLKSTRIGAGDYLAVRPNTASAPASSRPLGGGTRYTVRPGDNLASIASRHGATVAQLREWNGLRSTTIRAGQSLIVGEGGDTAPEPVVSAAAPEHAPAPARQSAPAPTSDSDGSGEYRIRPGDSLGSIADRYGVTAADLRRWNNLRGNRIIAGATLKVREPAAAPSAPRPTSATAASSSATGYVVRSGDTLGVIANRHGVTVQNLMAWNGLRSSRLSVGQKLRVEPPAGGVASYQVRPGDTLEVIAKRFNVSVPDLMAWNGLSSTRIGAGTVLRVQYTERAAGGGD